MKRATTTFLLIITLVALFVASEALYNPTGAQSPNKVGLVVRFGDSTVFTDCIEFTEAEITGEDVLDRSGLSVVKDLSYGLGAAICKIEDDGCNHPQQHCFCQCQGAECQYWGYYHLDQQDNEWVYSGMGASWHSVQPGDVEGWSWGAGDAGESDVEPPLLTFEDLCAPPTPPVVDFTADATSLTSGQCSVLRWTVENAEVVVLGGQGVMAEDSRYVCPSQTRTYELEVLNEAGQFTYEVTISVSQPTSTPPPTSTPTTVPGATSTPTDVPQPPTQVPTALPSLGSPSPSPSATSTPSPTSSPTVVAMAPVSTTPSVAEIVDPPRQVEPVEPPPQESVGLNRILLLLSVGAGTLGFGGLVFVAILILLMGVYLRARGQFTDRQDLER